MTILATLLLAALASPAGQEPASQSSPALTPLASPSPSPDLKTLIAEADAHFAQRSAGAVNDVADKREIDASIDLYRKAVAIAPDDIELLAKLMRAMHFRGAYTGAAIEEKKAIFEEGRKLGQDAVDRLEARARAARGMSRIESLRLVNGTPSLYLWTAGHWGEWALVRGKFAAARSGIAGRLRDLAQTVIDLDPAFEDAAGYRILGRLHSEAPKIPFITGWVSRDKALQYLRRAYATGPRHPVTWYFLAGAILEHEPEKREEAMRLLDLCANTPPRLDTPLEDARYATLARKQLDQLRSTSAQ